MALMFLIMVYFLSGDAKTLTAAGMPAGGRLAGSPIDFFTVAGVIPVHIF